MSVFKSDIRQLNFRSTISDQNDPKIFINEPLVQCAVSLTLSLPGAFMHDFLLFPEAIRRFIPIRE